MKCLLIGIALSACLSVWTGPDTTKLSSLDRSLPGIGSQGSTHISTPAAIR